MTKIVKPSNNKTSHGASNAFKGIKKGTSASCGLNGVKWSREKDELTTTNDDSTVSASTIKGSTSIGQHKTLAMTGHT